MEDEDGDEDSDEDSEEDGDEDSEEGDEDGDEDCADNDEPAAEELHLGVHDDAHGGAVLLDLHTEMIRNISNN